MIKLAYEALNKVTNYQDVQTNIQLLLNNYQLNVKKIVTYFNTLFKTNYTSLTDIFKEQDTTQLIENFETFVTILENKAYFYQLISIPLPFQVKNSYNFDSLPSYQASNYVKLNINNSNLYFKKIYQNEQQEGWNCGDVALGIERTWLVDELLKNSANKKIRNFLSPEIKTAIMLAATYEEDSKIKEAELIDLLSLQNAKQDKNLSSSINARINELLDNPDDSAYIKIDAKVRNIINTYIEAHENMKEAVKLCNNQLGKIEGKLLSLQDLDIFFANEVNKQQYHDIYQAFQEKRDSILKPKEDELNNYYQRQDIFEKYIKDYYGKNEWMIYHPDISGTDNTSIFDAIAYLKNIQIVICKTNKANEIVIDFQTQKYGEDINYIFYNGQDHFIRLNVISEQEYESASNASQHVQPSDKSIAKHGFFSTKNSNSKQKSSDDTALREIIHQSMRQ